MSGSDGEDRRERRESGAIAATFVNGESGAVMMDDAPAAAATTVAITGMAKQRADDAEPTSRSRLDAVAVGDAESRDTESRDADAPTDHEDGDARALPRLADVALSAGVCRCRHRRRRSFSSSSLQFAHG